MASRTRNRTLLLPLAMLLPVVSGCAPHPRDQARPNVLLIVVDALRADRLECYGYPRQTSPSLTALAEDGVLFADVTAPAAETALSIPSLLSGRRAREHGVGWTTRDGKVYARRGAPLPALAEILRDRGYQTAAFSANPIVGPGLGLDRGFQQFGHPAGRLPVWRQGSAADLNGLALDWLRHHRKSGPFFLYLHYIDPHNLYRPPPEFCLFGRPGYTAEDERINVEMNLVSDPSAGGAVTDAALAARDLTRQDVTRLSDLYDGEVRCADHAIGELLRWLKQAGLYDDTVIVITADHGEAFLDHGELEHGGALYQELVHVPLIVRLPGLRAGQEVPEPVETVDIAPTILEAAGLGQTASMSGRSVYAELMQGHPIPEHLLVSELPAQQAYAARLGRLKLIISPSRTELYDLRTDPGERTNLATTRPQEVARLRAALQQELARHPAAATSAAPASREELDALRALGYIH